MKEIRPFSLKPKTKEYIWGGTELAKNWNKATEGARIAEAWELSLYQGMESIVGNGRYAQLTLDELGEAFPHIFGSKMQNFIGFPLLIKLIDAADNLSIQVHPSDEYALKNEGGELGKTEMWYILDAKDGAGIYYGFAEDITLEKFDAAIKDGTVTSLLNFVPAKRGDCFFIEAGTVHAILKGTVIYEVQENSNLTYRVFDYNRLDKDGKPRALHINKALAVSNLRKQDTQTATNEAIAYEGGTTSLLAECKYFCTKKIVSNTKFSVHNKESFTVLTVIDGRAEEDGTAYVKGDSVFVPAGTEANFAGEFSAICTTL